MEPRPDIAPEAGSPAGPPPRRSHATLGLALLVTAIVVGGAVHLAHGLRSRPPSTDVVTVKETPALLVAVRDLARLETTELHVEKVIDLTDEQSHLFGLVKATDALLLVASVDVTIGVDLQKLRDGDVRFDDETRSATICLPAPEIFSTRLDEKGTYVYSRSTGLLAKRNEALEERARKEAVRSVEETAKAGDALGRARAQAERQLRVLATELGAKDVAFRCD